MRLKLQINLLAVSIIFMVALFVSGAALLTIDRLAAELTEQRLDSELSWILRRVHDAHNILKDSGVATVPSYVQATQAELIAELRNFNLGKGGRLYLAAGDGTILSTADDRKASDLAPALISVITGQDNGRTRAQVAGLPSYVEFRTYPDWRWRIILVAPENEINAKRNQFLEMVLLILGLSVAVGMIMFAWFSDRLVRPILRLADHLSSLTNENSANNLQEERTSSEVSVLFDSFRSMSQRLAAAAAQKKEAEAELWEQANYDALTGLPNRRMFLDRLQQDIRRSARNGRQMALLFLDLDHFKDVNDSLGHDQGDLLLIEAAKRLHLCVRESDTLARIGGDEFTLIVEDISDRGVVDRIAEQMLERLTQPFQLGLETIFVSTSIGITIYPEDATDADSLLKHADQAMYTAKHHGRNCYRYYTPVLQEAVEKRVQLITDLRSAIADEQFLLHYQPIVDLQSGAICKAEALIRWHHPKRGMVSPVDFIHLAEETGLINPIGDWVFYTATRQTSKWRQSINADFRISINTSPAQFLSPANSMGQWLDHVDALGLAHDALVIEITESLLMERGEVVLDKLTQFHNADVQISLDDFGTGYSSLAYLHKFHIDVLKIDQSFVRDLKPASRELALCHAIIVMAHELGMKVVAEGIETLDQSKLLASAGCDFGQGYYFSRPLPAAEFEKLLAAGLPSPVAD